MNSLPLAVVYVLGFALALFQYRRLPRVAAAAGGGFGALLIMLMLRPAVDSLIFAILRSDGQSISVMLTLTGVCSICSAPSRWGPSRSLSLPTGPKYSFPSRANPPRAPSRGILGADRPGGESVPRQAILSRP